MNNNKLFSHLVAFQKTMFNHQYNMLTTWQNQGEQLAKSSMKYNPWCAGSGKTVCTFWAETFRQNSKYAKEFVDSNLSILEQYMDAPELSGGQVAARTTQKTGEVVKPVSRASVAKTAKVKDTSTAAKVTASPKKTVEKKAAPAKSSPPKKETTVQTGAAKKRVPKASPAAKKTTSAVKKAASPAKKPEPVQQSIADKTAASPQPNPPAKATAVNGAKSSG